MGQCFSSTGGEPVERAGPAPAAGGQVQAESTDRIQKKEADAAMALLQGDVPAEAATWVQVFVSANRLLRKDIMSESDPLAVVYYYDDAGGGGWREAGRTEIIKNTDSPDFVTSATVKFVFDKLQPMRVVYYDSDTKRTASHALDLSKQDFLGELAFDLAEVVASQGSRLTLPLERGLAGSDAAQVRGNGTVRVEQASTETVEDITLQFSAVNLDNKDTVGKSDPFLRISRRAGDGSWQPVFKTEVIKNNLDPTWRPLKISAAQLCNSEYERALLLEVFDWERDGGHDLIGSVQTSMQRLAELQGSGQTLSLAVAAKPGQPTRESGEIKVDSMHVAPRHSFLDYVQAGCRISFMVAIDFTASNGEPHQPSSLHHLRTGFLNPYQQAISAVGEVLQFYDDDRRFPAWGFGGALPNKKVQHCFQLSTREHVTGVEGIHVAYEQALRRYRLAGPTLFNEVICEAARIASQKTQEQTYHCLLILTDGCIMDMEQTIEAVVQASYTPLSIMLVGIGKSTDFRAMRVLDSDQHRLRTKDGREAMRDIVQFVEFVPGVTQVSHVSKQLLAELPGQLVEYMSATRQQPYGARRLRSGVTRPPPGAPGTRV